MGFFHGLKIFNSNDESLQSESYNIQVIYTEYLYIFSSVYLLVFESCKIDAVISRKIARSKKLYFLLKNAKYSRENGCFICYTFSLELVSSFYFPR